MPLFYPSVVVNFKLRFDEALHLANNPEPVSIEGRVGSPALKPGSAREVPLLLQRESREASFVMNRVPRKCTVELPPYRQAGTYNLVVDFKDLPIDPRTLRAAAVEIHIGTVAARDFATGMTAQNTGPGAPRASFLVTRNVAGQPNPDTLAMVGLVDEWEVEHGEDSSLVTISGRDMRCLLIDSPLQTKNENAQQIMEALDTSQTIDLLVRQILSFHPMHDEYRVEVNAAEWPDGVLPSPLASDLLPRHRRGAKGTRRGGRGNPPGEAAKMTFWDLITQYCYLVGAIPYFQGTALRIRPARSIFDQQRAGFDPRIATPFADGQPRRTDGTPPLEWSVRRMIYGRDVKTLKFKRKFAGNARPKVVRCVATDLSSPERGQGVHLEARWPPATAPRNARSTQASPGGQTAHEEITTIPVRGIRDQGRLLEIARNLYEEIGRNEMDGTCSTKNLASFGGDNDDPDLLRLHPGDAVEFYTDTSQMRARAPLVATLLEYERTPFEQAVEMVLARIGRSSGNEDLARVIVATARGNIAGIQRVFRVASVHYDWDKDKGIDVDFDFQNYFVQRAVDNSVGKDEGKVETRIVPKGGT